MFCDETAPIVELTLKALPAFRHSSSVSIIPSRVRAWRHRRLIGHPVAPVDVPKQQCCCIIFYG